MVMLLRKRLARVAGNTEQIAIAHRVCDLCTDSVTDGDHIVTKSFVLTDWGVICVECWDNRIRHYEEFGLIKFYAKSRKVGDEWIKRPLLFRSESERSRDAVRESNGSLRCPRPVALVHATVR